MVGLPENWEWDHDGKRWFYRYKPTGLIQYTFPKPGDEFPDFVEDDAPPLDLAPEERLVSQQQTRRRSTLGEDPSKPKRKEGKSSFILEEEDDDPGAYWERPDALMYMGPGAYNDISPLEDDIRQEDAKPDPPAPTQASQKAADVKPVTEQLDRIQISPLASAQTTPLVVNSQPISSPPENGVPIAEVSHTVIVAEVPAAPVAPAVPVVPAAPAVSAAPAPAPATVVAAPPAPAVNVFPDVPMLDGREIPHNPVGFVAELASELTAQCHDEIHPAPVELPGNEMMMEANAQQHPAIAYANAFPLAPAELHSEALLPSQVQKRHSVEQKALAMRPPELDGQLRQQPVIEAREPVQEIPPGARPAHLRQNSMPQPGQGHPQASNPGIDPAQGKFKPYNPGLRPVAENNTGGNQYAPSSTTGFSISSPPISSFGGGNKRHSLAGPPPSHLKGSEVRPGLQSIRTWQQLPPTEEREEAISRTHGSQPNNGQVAVDSGLAHIPSVLKPARGRPNLSQSPPRSQSPPSPPQVDPSQKYQAYQPIASIDQSLQQDIESTLNELSKTGYDYDTELKPKPPLAPFAQGRPTISRTSTLPADLPALPYMGVRPQMPPSAPSAPAALHTRASYQSFAHHHHTASQPLGREVGSTGFQAYAGSPPANVDIPQPLKISRNKSPPPATQNNRPSVGPSLRPPATVEDYVVSRETTPAPREDAVSPVPPIVHAGQGGSGGFHQGYASSHQTQSAASPYKLPELSFEMSEGGAQTSDAQNQSLQPRQSVTSVASEPATETMTVSSIQTAPIIQPEAQNQGSIPTGPATVFSINTDSIIPGPSTQISEAGFGSDHQAPPQVIPQRDSSWQAVSQANQSTQGQNLGSPPPAGAGYQQSGPQSSQYFPPVTSGPVQNLTAHTQHSGPDAHIRPQTPPGHGTVLAGPVSPPDAADLDNRGSFTSASIGESVKKETGPPRPPKTPHDPSPESTPGKSASEGRHYSSSNPPLPSMPLTFQGSNSVSPPATAAPPITQSTASTNSGFPAAQTIPSGLGPSSPPSTMNMPQYQSSGGSNMTNLEQQKFGDNSTHKPLPNAPQSQAAPNSYPAQTIAASTGPYQPAGQLGNPPPGSAAPQFRPHTVTGFRPEHQQPMPSMGGQFQRPGGSLPQIYPPIGLTPTQPPPMPIPPGQNPGPLPQRSHTIQSPIQQGIQLHSGQLAQSGASEIPQGQAMFTAPNYAGPVNAAGNGMGGGQSRPLLPSQQQPSIQQGQPVQQQQFIQQKPPQPPVQQGPPIHQQQQQQQQQNGQQRPHMQQQHPMQQRPGPQQQQQSMQQQPPMKLQQQRQQPVQQPVQQQQPMQQPLFFPQQHPMQQQMLMQQQAGPHQTLPPQNQGPGRMQHHPQSAAPPAHEEKSWLGGIAGKLWRHGSVKKQPAAGGSPPSATNKLQKHHPQAGFQQAQGPFRPGNFGQPPQPLPQGMPPIQQGPAGRQSGHFAPLPAQQQLQQQQQQFAQQQHQRQQSQMAHGRTSSGGGGLPVQGGPFYSQQGVVGSGGSSRVSSYSSSATGPGPTTQVTPANNNNNNGWGKGGGGYDGEGWGDGYD